MLPIKDINLEVSDEVITFVANNLRSLEMNDPVSVLVYMQFEDEQAPHYRISLSEREELDTHSNGKGFISKIPGLGELFIPFKLEDKVANKRAKLVVDIVEFESYT